MESATVPCGERFAVQKSERVKIYESSVAFLVYRQWRETSELYLDGERQANGYQEGHGPRKAPCGW